jgi:hypothetical protein
MPFPESMTDRYRFEKKTAGALPGAAAAGIISEA